MGGVFDDELVGVAFREKKRGGGPEMKCFNEMWAGRVYYMHYNIYVCVCGSVNIYIKTYV